jgi:tyrosine-protein phosphatase SIW14
MTLALNRARVWIAAALFMCSFQLSAAERNHQSSPAQSVEGSRIDNIYRVSAELYRSGQPSAQQMHELQAMGVKSILNLRQYNSDDKEARGTTLQLYHIRMNAGRINDEQMIEALSVISRAPKPVLVHCWHGSDRTGAVVAMYRIVFENWTKQAAIDELMQPQYGHHETVYRNIARYIEQVDVEAIRAAINQN